ncbi:MAG: glycosyltransferase [bacterium]
MKICVITSLYKPYSKGGAERVVEDIVKGLAGKGHEVLVVTTGHLFAHPSNGIKLKHSFCEEPALCDSRTGYRQDAEQIKIIRFYPCNLFWFWDIDKKKIWLRLPWHIIDVFNLYSYFKIKKILKKGKPDIVMTHNLKGIGYTAPVAIRVCGIKHIHTAHDVQLVEPSGLISQENKKAKKQKNNIIIKIYSFFTRILFASPDIVISPSEWLLAFYTSRGFFPKSRKLVMRNPIPAIPSFLNGPFQKQDSSLAKEGEESRSARDGYSNSHFAKEFIDLNLLYIGQIEEHKGIVFLINAVKKLENICLDIIGTGTKMDAIKTICKDCDRIKIRGFIENSQVYNFIVQNDFVIVPSLCAENAPKVIYESFSCGAPVIASNIGGIPELVKNGYNGYVFEAGIAESLRAVIKKCIKEKDRWRELRENTLKSIEGWDIDKYLDLLLKEIFRD